MTVSPRSLHAVIDLAISRRPPFFKYRVIRFPSWLGGTAREAAVIHEVLTA
jgi:hypothetical protein